MEKGRQNSTFFNSKTLCLFHFVSRCRVCKSSTKAKRSIQFKCYTCTKSYKLLIFKLLSEHSKYPLSFKSWFGLTWFWCLVFKLLTLNSIKTNLDSLITKKDFLRMLIYLIFNQDYPVKWKEKAGKHFKADTKMNNLKDSPRIL